MAFIDNLVRITIKQAAAPVAATQTNIPILIANTSPAWEDGKAVHSYGGLEELLADGFDEDSDTYAFAQKMLSGDTKPPTFLVGVKAGSALATSDLDAMAAADNSFYAIVPVAPTDDEILTAANWVQAQSKMLFAASSTASNADASSKTSLAYQLRNGSYYRTALLYTPQEKSAAMAAWVGSCITITPGQINWAYQTLPGIQADSLPTSALTACLGDPVDEVAGNGCNVYVSQYKKGATLLGTTSTSYIDLVQGEDYLTFQLQAAVYSKLVSGNKVPMTDKGVAVFIAAVKEVLDQAASNGLINDQPVTPEDGPSLPRISVYAEPVASIPMAQRANRRCPTIHFTATLAGAVNSVAVTGVLSV